jgi:dihydroorotate dehydrogenase electron transfer subunit
VNFIQAEVTENRQLLPELKRPHTRCAVGGYLIWLRCPEISARARPGQFVMVRCGEQAVLPRPFSIHQADGERIALLYTVWEDGRGTPWLSRQRSGDLIHMFGPLGNGFTIQSDSRRLLLVAGGIGLAPLGFLTRHALQQNLSVTLLYGTCTRDRYPGDLLPAGLDVVDVTEDGSVGKTGLATDYLPDLSPRADQIFACGPMGMYRDMDSRRKQMALEGKPVQVSLEVRMGCGVGVCYGCTIKTKTGLKQVCQDGPVFELSDVLWEQLEC